MLGRTLRVESGLPEEPAIVLGTLADLAARPNSASTADLPPDGYWLTTASAGGVSYTVITAANDRGVLYGAFAFLRKIALGEPVAKLDEKQSPYAPVRWVNEWDNLDGTIERGYGGRSIFWDNLQAREDLTPRRRLRPPARLARHQRAAPSTTSTPTRACSPPISCRRSRASPRPSAPGACASRWPSISAAPKPSAASTPSIRSMPKVAAWWKARVDALYAAIPDLAGFVLKADSEGRVGPSTYGRTHADAANVVARALQPHGGLLFYRGFVYDHHIDWSNPKNDRGRAAYDNFQPLDGKFDDNVIVQIKHGPIDFQVREPASPLFGALEKTNQAIELQITQEYFGQARHTVFLVPMWKEVLDFDMHAAAGADAGEGAGRRQDLPPPDRRLRRRLQRRPRRKLVRQSPVAGQPLRLRPPRLESRSERAAHRRRVDQAHLRQRSQSRSRPSTPSSSPPGAPTKTTPARSACRPSPTSSAITTASRVEASERNGWGQWHSADEKGVGMDRTVATGTGYIGQYRPAVAKVYESLETCPDDLLLFLHHVPYTYKLHSGKTVIQYIYDSHYEGAEAVGGLRARVEDAARAASTTSATTRCWRNCEYQAGTREVWRDAVNDWFQRASGIADAKGRVGRHPGRIEAEAMKLEGYTVRDVTPWETASGGKAVACPVAKCTAGLRYDGAPGWYTLHVQYFDQTTASRVSACWVGTQLVDEWTAADRLPARKLDSSSSTRRDRLRNRAAPRRRDPHRRHSRRRRTRRPRLHRNPAPGDNQTGITVTTRFIGPPEP